MVRKTANKNWHPVFPPIKVKGCDFCDYCNRAIKTTYQPNYLTKHTTQFMKTTHNQPLPKPPFNITNSANHSGIRQNWSNKLKLSVLLGKINKLEKL